MVERGGRAVIRIQHRTRFSTVDDVLLAVSCQSGGRIFSPVDCRAGQERLSSHASRIADCPLLLHIQSESTFLLK